MEEAPMEDAVRTAMMLDQAINARVVGVLGKVFSEPTLEGAAARGDYWSIRYALVAHILDDIKTSPVFQQAVVDVVKNHMNRY
jgi:hypothetical protein